MSIKFTKLSLILVAGAIASSLMTGVAQAESISETFNEAYFENTGDAFENSTILGQLEFIFGIGGFAENKIAKDGKLINIIYQDVMEQQAENGPNLVTRDLRNPFNTSVAEQSRYRRINNSRFAPEFDRGF